MSKIFKILMIFILFFTSAVNSFASINSADDLKSRIKKLEYISKYDYTTLFNKTELIGYRLDYFNMMTSQFKNNVNASIMVLNSISYKIEVINKSEDFSDTDKKIQTETLLRDAETALYYMNSNVVSYLSSLKGYMSYITFKKYVRAFEKFYNSQHLTDSQVDIGL